MGCLHQLPSLPKKCCHVGEDAIPMVIGGKKVLEFVPILFNTDFHKQVPLTWFINMGLHYIFDKANSLLHHKLTTNKTHVFNMKDCIVILGNKLTLECA